MDKLIDRIVSLIDSGEYYQNPYDFMEARRLLRNELPAAVEEEVKRRVKWEQSETREIMSLSL